MWTTDFGSKWTLFCSFKCSNGRGVDKWLKRGAAVQAAPGSKKNRQCSFYPAQLQEKPSQMQGGACPLHLQRSIIYEYCNWKLENNPKRVPGNSFVDPVGSVGFKTNWKVGSGSEKNAFRSVLDTDLSKYSHPSLSQPHISLSKTPISLISHPPQHCWEGQQNLQNYNQIMLILEKVHLGFETNWKIGYGSEKNFPDPRHCRKGHQNV